MDPNAIELLVEVGRDMDIICWLLAILMVAVCLNFIWWEHTLRKKGGD